MDADTIDQINAYLDALGYQLRDSMMKLVQLQKVMKELQEQINTVRTEEQIQPKH